MTNRYIRSVTGCSSFTALLAIILINFAEIAYAQNPSLDTAAMKHWNRITEGTISPDGQSVLYGEYGDVGFINASEMQWTIRSVSGNWSLNLGKGDWTYKTFYYGHGHRWLLLKGYISQNSVPDSLKIIDLTSKKTLHLSGIVNYKTADNALYLLRKNGAVNELVVQTGLETNRVLATHLTNTSLEQYGDNLLLITKDEGNQNFKFFNVRSEKITELFSVPNGASVTINATGTKFAYLKTGPSGSQAWIYDVSKGKSWQALTSNPLPEEPQMQLDAVNSFSGNDKYLIFTVKPNNAKTPESSTSSKIVKIWSYDAENLSGKSNKVSSFVSVLSLKDKRVRRLQFDHDDGPNIKGDWALITHRTGNGDDRESNWNKAAQREYRLVSLLSGKTKTLNGNPNFSDDGNFVFFIDAEKQNMLFYDLSNDKILDILNPIKGSHLAYYHDVIDGEKSFGWEIQWLNHDSLLLVRDQYNIWRINVAGDRKPVRLTGTGINDDIVFDLLGEEKTLKPGDTLYLTAFDRKTKANGLYEMIYSSKPLLKKLYMGPYLTYSKSIGKTISGIGLNQEPQRASEANVWLIARQSAEESPNLFTTTDFKDFKPVTDIHPERACNWFKTELYNWTGLNGESLQGILYKPQDFDPKKKYPVIFYYYEKVSNGLNVFIQPELCSGPMEIPWFVSHGYLVFTPDIFYKIGYPGQSALSSVESAAEMISKLPFVNPKKMGIQGHSFGGFETNYIVTHSNRFAAAATASGINNYIADYQERGPAPFENGQHRIKDSLFDRPDLYIENSSILRLKEVSIPLLVMHTTDDSRCSYAQGKALFTGLRRLGKPSWMLTYPNENHTLANREAQYDYTIKMQQFFDHYLKDAPKSDWMSANEQHK